MFTRSRYKLDKIYAIKNAIKKILKKNTILLYTLQDKL